MNKFIQRIYTFIATLFILLQITSPLVEAATTVPATNSSADGVTLIGASQSGSAQVTLNAKYQNSGTSNRKDTITVSSAEGAFKGGSGSITDTDGSAIGSYITAGNQISVTTFAQKSGNGKLVLNLDSANLPSKISFTSSSKTVSVDIVGNENTSTSADDSSSSSKSASSVKTSGLKARDASSPVNIGDYLPDDYNGTIITDADIKFTDSNGNVVPDDKLTNDTNVNIKYTWSIPDDLRDDYEIKNGDYFEFKLPEGVTYAPGTGSLDDYGTYSIKSDGTVRFTFNENAAGIGDFHGTFNYSRGKLDFSEPGDKTITIPTTSGPVTKEITIKNKGGQSISKTGVLSQTDPSSVTWTVDINTEQEKLKDAKIKEDMPKELDLESTKIFVLNVNSNGGVTGTGDELKEGSDYTVDSDGNISFIGSYANTNKAFRIVYGTKIKDSYISDTGENLTLTNNATLDNNGLENSAHASVTTNFSKMIKKTSTQGVGNEINWNINFNPNNKKLDAKEAEINDTLSDNSKYVKDSIEVKTKDGTSLKNGEDYNVVFDDASNSMKIEFPNGLDKEVNVTYKSEYTGILNGDGNKPEVKNKVSGGGDNDETSSHVNNTGVDKSPDYNSIDYTNREVTYNITFNQDKQEFHNATITDTMAKGLTLKGNPNTSDTFKIIDQDSEKELDKSKYNVDVQSDGGFVVTFKGLSDKESTHTYLITYVAKFDYGELNESNGNQFKNTVTYTWTDKNGDDHSSSKESWFKPSDSFRMNGSKSGRYNAKNKTISWSVGVNYQAQELENATITDVIQDGQVYQDGSARLFEVKSIDANGQYQYGDEIGNAQISYDKSSKKLSVSLPKSTKLYVLTYDTSIDNTLIQSSYKNTAKFTNDGKDYNLEATVSVQNGGNLLSKTGNQSTEDSSKTDWKMTVNASRSTIENAYLIDVPSDNQMIDLSTIKIEKAAVDDNGNLGAAESQLELGKDYTIEKGINGSFTIKFTKTISDAYYVTYSATIDSDKTHDTLKNVATLYGSENKNLSGDQTGSVTVINNSGSAEGGTYKAKLIKKDADTGATLSGARFTLWKKRPDDNYKKISENLTTDQNGEIEVNTLKSGTYYFEETVAPDGYEVSKDKQEFVVNASNADKPVVVTIKDKQRTGSVELTKSDAETNAKLEGALFNLYEKDGTLKEANLTTNSLGVIRYSGLKTGKYYFEEVKAPAGYQISKKQIPFEIKLDSIDTKVTVDAIDEQKTGSVKLTKQDVDTKDKLAGAEFSLYNKDGKELQSGLKTDTNGELVIKDLKFGEYYFKETKAPVGYKLSDHKYMFTINASNVDNEIKLTATDEAKLGSVKLIKQDADDEKTKLAGAEFSLYNKDGKELRSNLKTDANGELVVSDLKVGGYYFKETKAPEGYKLSDHKYTFVITNANIDSVVKVKATDEAKLGSVKLTKQDVDTKAKLAGAEFSLYNKDGKELRSSLKTDANGELVVSDLRVGEYYFKETKAPEGYKLSDHKYTFVITNSNVDSMIKVTVTDEAKLGSVKLIKTDSSTGDKLSGAKFSLYSKTGQEIKTGLTTDVSGELTVKKLEIGSYYFSETKAPEGYKLSNEKYSFEVSAANVDTVQVVKATNQRQSTIEQLGAVKLIKTDINTGKQLSGAEFSLYSETGKLLQKRLTTDNSGELVVDDLKVGHYYFKETKAPVGYQMDADKKYSFKISLQNISQLVLVRVSDTPDGPNTESTPPSDGSKASSQSSSKEQKRIKGVKGFLPQTGEQYGILLSVLGVIILATTAVVIYRRHRD